MQKWLEYFFERSESRLKSASRVWNQRVKFKIRESKGRDWNASQIWNQRVKFEISHSSLKSASRVWNTWVEFEIRESSLKSAALVWNTRVELAVSGWGMKFAVGVIAPLGFRRNRQTHTKVSTVSYPSCACALSVNYSIIMQLIIDKITYALSISTVTPGWMKVLKNAPPTSSSFSARRLPAFHSLCNE